MTSQRSTKDLRVVFAAQDITQSISDVSQFAQRFGGMADIHKGVWVSDSGNQTVAIKFIRSGDDELEKTLRRHRREIRVWHGIDHPNILRLVGLYWGSGRKLPAMVSMWCEHTNLRHFVKELPPGPAAMAQKYTLLEQILSGLAHLHSQSPPIVHGDLKGDNILLSADGTAKICDFGLAKIVEVTTETSTRVRGTCRWMAPELLLEERPVSTPGDIWAYACVIMEVLTGLLPYSHIQKDAGVILAQSRGQIPNRPEDASDACWNLALKCFTFEPAERPSASDLLDDPLFDLVGPSVDNPGSTTSGGTRDDSDEGLHESTMAAPHMLAAPKQVACDLPPQTFVRFEIPLPDVDSAPLPTPLRTVTVHLPTVHYPTRSSPKVSGRDHSLPPASFGEYENTRYTPVPSNPTPQAVPTTLPSHGADSSHTNAPPDTASIPSLSIRTKFPYPVVAAQAHVAHSAAERLKKTLAEPEVTGVTNPNKGQESPGSPPGFHRGRSLLHEYTPFEAFLILADLNGFYQQTPRLPAALVSHDVFHEDWIRAMQDLAFAWCGRIPAPELGDEIGRNDRLHPGEVVAAMVDIWNARFFEPRLVQLIVYRGRVPLSGHSESDRACRESQRAQFGMAALRSNKFVYSLCIRSLPDPNVF